MLAAGQVSGLVKSIRPAGEVLADMVAGAADLLGRGVRERITLA